MTEEEQRVQAIAERVAQKALGIAWEDTESQARRVAEQAGADLHATFQGVAGLNQIVEMSVGVIEELAGVVGPLMQRAILEPETAARWTGKSRDALDFAAQLRNMLKEGRERAQGAADDH